MARAATLLERSYIGTWLLIAVLYLGGIACYSVTYVVDKPEYSSVLYPLGPALACLLDAITAWCLNMLGAPLAICYVLFQGFWRVETIEDAYSASVLVLLSVYTVSVVLVYDLARHLRKSLAKRFGPIPRQDDCLASECCSCCCPVRLLGTPLLVAETRQRELRDEVPAYVAA